MNLIPDIAQAVVDEMNDAESAFSMPFEAVRAYVPKYDLAEMGVLHVTVIPRSSESEQLTRSDVQEDVVIDIAVQQKVLPTDLDAIDDLMALVREIDRFFRLRTLEAVEASWVKSENNPIYSPEHLKEKSLFTSVLSLTYRVL